MKYYVYTALWRTKNESVFRNVTTGFQKCKNIVELFEKAAIQPEVWAITSYAEISENEYDEGVKRRTLG